MCLKSEQVSQCLMFQESLTDETIWMKVGAQGPGFESRWGRTWGLLLPWAVPGYIMIMLYFVLRNLFNFLINAASSLSLCYMIVSFITTILVLFDNEWKQSHVFLACCYCTCSKSLLCEGARFAILLSRRKINHWWRLTKKTNFLLLLMSHLSSCLFPSYPMVITLIKS